MNIYNATRRQYKYRTMKNSVPTCRSCGAMIIWMKTKNGKNIPVDWDVRFVDDDEFSIPAGHISHFSTCPYADQHRKPKK